MRPPTVRRERVLLVMPSQILDQRGTPWPLLLQPFGFVLGAVVVAVDPDVRVKDVHAVHRARGRDSVSETATYARGPGIVDGPPRARLPMFRCQLAEPLPLHLPYGTAIRAGATDRLARQQP